LRTPSELPHEWRQVNTANGPGKIHLFYLGHPGPTVWSVCSVQFGRPNVYVPAGVFEDSYCQLCTSRAKKSGILPDGQKELGFAGD
jgi:hypothetical protein